MSSKWIKWIKLICRAVLVGIGTVQLVYAIAWAIGNGNNVQDFYDTALYLSNAENLTSDGWRLIGYSYILRPFLQLKGVMGDFYVLAIYLMQVVVSVLCFAEGFRNIMHMMSGKKMVFYQALLPAVYIVTIPVIWQMQFAILPDAICLSLTVLLFSKITESVCESDRFCWDCYLVIAGCFLMLGIMHRHYFYGAFCVMVIDIFVLFIRFLVKKYRSVKSFLGACIVLVILLFVPIVAKPVNESVPKETVYATYSIEADLWSRFVYPNLAQDYEEYSERITAMVNENTAEAYAGTYELYMNSIGPMIESNNPEAASDIYWEMVETGWRLHKEEWKQVMVKELISYLFMPFSMVKYMYYSGVSLYGHNYTKMHEINPALTADYMHVSMMGYMVISLIGCIMFVLLFISENKLRVKKILMGLYSLTAMLFLILPLMLFAVARFDYRIGLFSVFIWAIFAVANICGPKSEGDECE